MSPMPPIFSRAALQASPALARWLAISFVASCVLIVWTQSPTGDFLFTYTDHLHHARATWAFLCKGWVVYRDPLIVTSQGIGYLQGGLTWEQSPVHYPPGMFAVFLFPAILGRYLGGSEAFFGKIVIVYLCVITHAALWAIAQLFRRVDSKLWIAVLVFIWLFLVKMTLLGFYDSAWLLTGALGVDQLQRKKHGPAVGWFLLSALINYRAAAFAVLGVWALVELLRSDAPRSARITWAAATVAACAVVGWAFAMLLIHTPPGPSGASSALLPMRATSWVVLISGLAAGAVLGRSVSLLVGLTVAATTVLGVIHAGHQWHGVMCVPALLALTLSPRQPLVGQVVLTLWLLVMMRYAFWVEPFQFLDELIRFVSDNGRATERLQMFP